MTLNCHREPQISSTTTPPPPRANYCHLSDTWLWLSSDGECRNCSLQTLLTVDASEVNGSDSNLWNKEIQTAFTGDLSYPSIPASDSAALTATKSVTSHLSSLYHYSMGIWSILMAQDWHQQQHWGFWLDRVDRSISLLVAIWDAHVKDMGWAVCVSSWSPRQMTNDMRITDTNVPFQTQHWAHHLLAALQWWMYFHPQPIQGRHMTWSDDRFAQRE